MKKTLKNNKKKPLIPLFSKILLALAAISLAIFVIAKKKVARRATFFCFIYTYLLWRASH